MKNRFVQLKNYKLNIEDAKNSALTFINDKFPCLDDDEKLVIYDEVTEEFSWGWAFVVQTKKFLETKDYLYACVGIGQIVVDKIKDEIIVGPSSDPNYASKYNRQYGGGAH